MKANVSQSVSNKILKCLSPVARFWNQWCSVQGICLSAEEQTSTLFVHTISHREDLISDLTPVVTSSSA